MNKLTLSTKIENRISVKDLVSFINYVESSYGIMQEVKHINAYDYKIIDDEETETMTTIKIYFEVFYDASNDSAVRNLVYTCYRAINHSCSNIRIQKASTLLTK